MGLFNRYDGSMNDDMAIAPKAGDGKIYRLVQLLAISAFLIAVVLVILEIFQILPMSANTNGVVFSIGVLGAGGMIALPWVRVFEVFKEKPYKITAIVFLALAGVCVILWIICVWLIIGLIKKAIMNDVDISIINSLVNSLNAIRASLIVSLQFVVASYVAKNVIKYKKTLLPYQIMAGLSQLFIDAFLCIVLTALTITTEGVEFSKTAILLTNRWTWALFVIAIVLGIFPTVVFRRTDRRNILRARSEGMYETFGAQPDDSDNAPAAANTANANTANIDPFDMDPFYSTNTASSGPSVDEKLRKIKDLLDKGLITQEEYDKKREDIINSI